VEVAVIHHHANGALVPAEQVLFDDENCAVHGYWMHEFILVLDVHDTGLRVQDARSLLFGTGVPVYRNQSRVRPSRTPQLSQTIATRARISVGDVHEGE